MSLVLRSPQEIQAWRTVHSSPGIKIGFVPTMGALHRGHETLLQQARQQCDLVVLSIYVNKTQFNDPQDFEKYPLTWEEDLNLAKKNSVDLVFAPRFEDMYPDQYLYKVSEQQFSHELCGKDRPGHFDGVLTIVMKLLNLVRPDRAYFGEKDFQQLRLIQGMIEAFFMSCLVVPVETVREAGGLALSSRNQRLSPEDRLKASLIYRVLKDSKTPAEAIQKLEHEQWKVDYVIDRDQRRFAAVRIGEVRLIDNVQI